LRGFTHGPLFGGGDIVSTTVKEQKQESKQANKAASKRERRRWEEHLQNEAQ